MAGPSICAFSHRVCDLFRTLEFSSHIASLVWCLNDGCSTVTTIIEENNRCSSDRRKARHRLIKDRETEWGGIYINKYIYIYLCFSSLQKNVQRFKIYLFWKLIPYCRRWRRVKSFWYELKCPWKPWADINWSYQKILYSGKKLKERYVQYV